MLQRAYLKSPHLFYFFIWIGTDGCLSAKWAAFPPPCHILHRKAESVLTVSSLAQRASAEQASAGSLGLRGKAWAAPSVLQKSGSSRVARSLVWTVKSDRTVQGHGAFFPEALKETCPLVLFLGTGEIVFIARLTLSRI